MDCVRTAVRLGAEQGERLGQRGPVALHIVGAPQCQADRRRPVAELVVQSLHQAVGLGAPLDHGRRGGHPPRVKAVCVAPSGQHRRIANDVTPRCWRDVAGIKRLDHRVKFRIALKALIQIKQGGGQLARCRPVEAFSGEVFCGRRRITLQNGLHVRRDLVVSLADGQAAARGSPAR